MNYLLFVIAELLMNLIMNNLLFVVVMNYCCHELAIV